MAGPSVFYHERDKSFERLSVSELVEAAADPIVGVSQEDVGVVVAWLDTMLAPLSPQDKGCVFEHQTEAMSELASRMGAAAAQQHMQLQISAARDQA